MLSNPTNNHEFAPGDGSCLRFIPTASHQRAGAPAKVFRQKILRNRNLVGKIFIFKDFGWDLITLLFDFLFPLVKLARSDEKRRETAKDPVPC